ncbi:hypothetical protein WR25_21405 [Diploscapter pachys]|uniref:Uncharacterized protein n=1 Tax=Diploscapter pachys TaxID=2018661 RepID=A0A2A2JCX1_9BILA|nr:hypothetical protein WR25_21405 [Diploscapter pachys]
MHPLLGQLLEQRHLSSARLIFSLNDYDVISDLHSSLKAIREIFDSPDYVDNRVDQSVVEIALARITAAIRETNSMEAHAAALVALLDSALSHELSSTSSGFWKDDSPHCKIVLDLLSSLFLNYGKRSIMILVLPMAMKALTCKNEEIIRNTSSYIALAAIHNGKTLSHYSLQIIANIINNGNYSLLRVLPQVYNYNQEPIEAHLPKLLELLHRSQARIT